MTLEQLLKKWLGKEGGAERANYQMFLAELTQALDLPAPDPKGMGLGDYQFEAPVRSEAALGTKGTGRIDLYKRDCFILEAKQSQLKPGEALPADPPEPPPEPIRDLFGTIIGHSAAGAKRVPRYDRLMADARVQAERYALALPAEHKAPPFLIVADIGRSFEVYFDWSANGRGYGPFPDERTYRVRLEDLRDSKVRERFAAIWTDPHSIDPRLKAAEVTRDVAERLSKVAKALEADQRNLRPGDAMVALGIEETSLFLMRLLFCMFAEDVAKDQPSDEQLLPKGSFQSFLESSIGKSDHYWRAGLTELWSKMNEASEADRYWSFGDAMVRHFNGNLFASAKVFVLPDDAKTELLTAAKRDWRSVEPAIFGTLLEQVLTPADRAKLGAHYTPRAYVERLVEAAMMELLRPEWESVLAAARASADAGDSPAAVAAARAFHHRLAALAVLDPACGTGNFLYVAMDQLLRLESEVRQFAAGLGAVLDPRIHPNQFLGLEINPRAAVIAELVLWIGWLRYRLANTPEAIGDPVLPTLSNINFGTHGGYDAVLARTATGEPDTDNPRRPPWPEADFIIGNPPFLGKGSIIREALTDNYVEALWAANPAVPKSADFVMQWWDRAADILTRAGTRLKRFGFVTTNSITQVFSRRVIERHLADASPLVGEDQGGGPAASAAEKTPLSLVFAIPDHPWTRASRDAAAVRIAMTVAEAGPSDGVLLIVNKEDALDTDEPAIEMCKSTGRITARLRLDDNLPEPQQLESNRGLSNTGMLLAGSGFKLEFALARELQADANADTVIRPYVSGGEILGRPRFRSVIDFHGYSEAEARKLYPLAYDHLLKTVLPVRKHNNDPARRDRWWLFGRSNTALRAQIEGLTHYIATTETAKHRVFQLVPAEVVPDHMVITIGLDIFGFGILSSKIHVEWALEMGGTLEDRPRYNKTVCFDPFPFPDGPESTKATVESFARDLDATRRAALAENEKLTMTGLYNLVEAVRSDSLPPDQEAQAARARARIIAKLHDDLDLAVADAYGWGDEWRRAPLPPAEIVARLVALNAERAAEEKAGTIRWLRPDYQEPRFGK